MKVIYTKEEYRNVIGRLLENMNDLKNKVDIICDRELINNTDEIARASYDAINDLDVLKIMCTNINFMSCSGAPIGDEENGQDNDDGDDNISAFSDDVISTQFEEGSSENIQESV